MRLKRIGRFTGLFGAAALAAVLTFSYGCSEKPKEEKKAEPAAAAAQTQQQPADPVKAAFEKALTHTANKEYDAAIAAYAEVMKLNPNIPDAYSNTGFIYFDKGKAVAASGAKADIKKAHEFYDKAIEYQKKALEVDKAHANAYFGIAQSLENKGDNKGAIKNWKEFLKHADPHNQWRPRVEDHLKELQGQKKKS